MPTPVRTKPRPIDRRIISRMIATTARSDRTTDLLEAMFYCSLAEEIFIRVPSRTELILLSHKLGLSCRWRLENEHDF